MREIQSNKGEVKYFVFLTANELIQDQMKHLYNSSETEQNNHLNTNQNGHLNTDLQNELACVQYSNVLHSGPTVVNNRL